MREFAVVGRPNSGKTLFALQFAGFLGCKAVDVTFRSPDGLLNCRHFALSEAKRELCAPTTHKTRHIQSVQLRVPVGKTQVAFKLTDTCGISESIHGEEAVRKGMAQTLSLIRSTDYILHLIDAAVFRSNFADCEANIDREIYQYGVAKSKYILLANKIDLPAARDNLGKITAAFSQCTVLPISALYSQGFQEVKAYVAGNV